MDNDLKALRPQLQPKQLPRDPRGSTPGLSAAEVLTILVWGAWRGLTDKAKGIFTSSPITGESSQRSGRIVIVNSKTIDHWRY
jgi:hypothetical protein